jgi:hypothetical protein
MPCCLLRAGAVVRVIHKALPGWGKSLAGDALNNSLFCVLFFYFCTLKHLHNMRFSKTTIWIFVALIILSALYRIIPDRPLGFAPQFAIALFAGAVIKDRALAFIVPLLSIFLSDLLYQALFMAGMTDMQGFYSGQWENYVLIAGVTAFGFLIRKINVLNVLAAAFAAPTLYFLVSNFLVWAGHGGLQRPKTFDGLLMCYNDALPFYRGSLMATVVFSVLLFGGYYLLHKPAKLNQLAK